MRVRLFVTIAYLADPDWWRSLVVLDGTAGVALGGLLDEGEADTLVLGEADESLLAGAHAENVGETGGEGVAAAVTHVGDLVGTGVVLDVLEDTDATDVVSAGHEDGGAVLELDEAVDLTGLKVVLQGELL